MTSDFESGRLSEYEPLWEVLAPPVITAPTATTVSRRFNVHAVVPSLGHNKWNLDFFRVRNNQKIRRYSGGEGIGFIEFVVPDELPVEEQIYFKIQYQSVLYSHWARSHNFKIGQVRPPAPVITHPGTVWVPKPEIQGTGGVAGATVMLYEDGVGTILFGTATVQSNGSWRTVLSYLLWMADPFPLTAMQKLNGMESGWSPAVKFAVLFKPVITEITVSADGKPTIQGRGGLSNATVQIWNSGGGGGVLLTTPVRPDGSWSVTASTAWEAGRYSITAAQIGSVTKAQSDWAVVKDFAVRPPKPSIPQPPNPVAPKQELVITGVVTGATLMMFTGAGNDHSAV